MAMVAITDVFVDTLLELAAEVERDEVHIKQALLEAARRGDYSKVERIAERWLRLPPGEVLDDPSKNS